MSEKTESILLAIWLLWGVGEALFVFFPPKKHRTVEYIMERNRLRSRIYTYRVHPVAILIYLIILVWGITFICFRPLYRIFYTITIIYKKVTQ